jgi:hypothetical protein
MEEDRNKVIEKLMEEELWRLKKDNNKIQVRKVNNEIKSN